jgi:antitoxin VapB
MAMNIKDLEAERLAAEVAALAGESKTQAVRVALRERRERLLAAADARRREERLRGFLADEVWPQIPEGVIGVPVTRAEREAILGYGPDGV